MKLSRDDQTKFAKEILSLEAITVSLEPLLHLNKLVSLLSTWTNPHNDIIVYLDEYMYEVIAIKRGDEDTGWKDEFKKKLDIEISIRDETMRPNSGVMSLSREDQNEFARAIVGIVDANERNPEVLGHLCKLSSLLIIWTEEGNGDTAIDLSEYIGELNDIANGGEDTGWVDHFKKSLYYDIGYEDRLEK